MKRFRAHLAAVIVTLLLACGLLLLPPLGQGVLPTLCTIAWLSLVLLALLAQLVRAGLLGQPVAQRLSVRVKKQQMANKMERQPNS